jgi:hypothetical protein
MINPKPSSFLLSPLSSLTARLRRSRPGSVLIIVIVLLLLLAILGAAYISTTRSARVASAQNTINSDVDDMINGIAKVCEGTIVDDLNDTFGDLHGNTGYISNTGANAIVNRSYYQGQAGANPNISPNVPAATGQVGLGNLRPYGGEGNRCRTGLWYLRMDGAEWEGCNRLGFRLAK